MSKFWPANGQLENCNGLDSEGYKMTIKQMITVLAIVFWTIVISHWISNANYGGQNAPVPTSTPSGVIELPLTT